MIVLSLAAEACALLTLGLVEPWGERVPMWVPRLGSRRIPTSAVVVPAAFGALAITFINSTSAAMWFGPENNGDPDAPHGFAGFVMAAAYAPMLLWGPLLPAVTIAYASGGARPHGLGPTRHEHGDDLAPARGADGAQRPRPPVPRADPRGDRGASGTVHVVVGSPAGRVVRRPGAGPRETVGRRTGRRHATALVYVDHHDGYAVIPANAGAPRHPDWWSNLQANQTAVVVVAGDRRPVRPRLASGADRDRLWRRFRQVAPVDHYQRHAGRHLPVVILSPTPSEELP